MHAERLTTRVKVEAFQGEACLLVYDAQQLTSTMLGDDVRELLDSRPGTAFIYILAPFISEADLRELLLSGDIVFLRLSSYFQAIGGRLCLLSFMKDGDSQIACEIPFSIDDVGKPKEEPTKPLDDVMRHGWLFDLFDRYRGRIDAPAGVHFAKSSRRHSTQFLRVSNILLSSTACAAVAYFTLGTLRCAQARRIFVDTAPLLAVAFALQRIANVHRIWELYAPVNSFSSYGGIDKLPTSSGRDLILVSASTSGGLVKELLNREFDTKYIATLFYLSTTDIQSEPGTVICDLTFCQGKLFGYPSVKSYSASNCPLCSKGYFLAELEGDQFQLEKRAIKHLEIKALSQTRDARETIDTLARQNLIFATTLGQRGNCTDFSIDADITLQNVKRVRQRFIRALRRYTPVPLDYVVLVNIKEETVRSLIDEAGLTDVSKENCFVDYSQLQNCPPTARGSGGVLVVFGTLSNFATARDINAQLRIKVPEGCVTYLSGITLANSAEHLADLKMFLTYGELGRETFTYEAAASLMLPTPANSMTAWQAEEQLLAQLRENGVIPDEISQRIDILLDSNERTSHLFWPGNHGELAIQNDFVYLSVNATEGFISQADILATIANLLATARMDNRGLNASTHNGQEPIRWHQSVYGHVVLSPAVFENYNDAILQAAFLRVSTPTELNYTSDNTSSNRILSIIRAAITAWKTGGGDSLPEFLIALATNRLSLASEHTQEIKTAVHNAQLPQYLSLIAETI